MGRRGRSQGGNLPSDDEVDAFHSEREQISLHHKTQPDQDSDSSDDAAVLDVSGASSESESGSDSDDDERVAVPDGFDDEDKNERELAQLQQEERLADATWGKKHGAYYGADTRDFELMEEDEDDEALLQDEEDEAIRLQRQRAKQQSNDDFAFDDDMLGAILKKPGKKSKKSQKNIQVTVDDDDLFNDLNLDDIVGTGADSDTQVEKIQKNLAHLSSDDKLQMVLTDSPELLGLLEDFKARLADFKELTAPCVTEIQKRGLLAPETRSQYACIEYFETLHTISVTYFANLSFYLVLKSSGETIKDHPVVASILSFRKLLDKLATIEDEMLDAVQNLFEALDNPSAATTTQDQFESTSEQDDAAELSDDAAAFDDAADFDDQDEEDSEDEMDALEREYLESLVSSKKSKKRRRGEEALQDFGDDLLEDDMPQAADNNNASALDRVSQRQQQADLDPMDDSWLENLDFGGGGDDDDGDDDDEADFDNYQRQAKQAKKAKKTRAEQYPKPAVHYGENHDVVPTKGADKGRREIGRAIEKNQGLKRYRKKKGGNARYTNRQKARKANVKQNARVQQYKGQTASYGGEQTGINKKVSKSTRF